MLTGPLAAVAASLDLVLARETASEHQAPERHPKRRWDHGEARVRSEDMMAPTEVGWWGRWRRDARGGRMIVRFEERGMMGMKWTSRRCLAVGIVSEISYVFGFSSSMLLTSTARQNVIRKRFEEKRTAVWEDTARGRAERRGGPWTRSNNLRINKGSDSFLLLRDVCGPT